MTDQKLRELERSDVAPETLLRARLREGVLPRQRVEIAAFLGNPLAKSVVDPWVPANSAVPSYGNPQEPRDALARLQWGGEWIRTALGALDRRDVVLAEADFAVRALHVWERHGRRQWKQSRRPAFDAPLQAVLAARAWAFCPCPEHQRQAELAAWEANDAASAARNEYAGSAARAAAFAAWGVSGETFDEDAVAPWQTRRPAPSLEPAGWQRPCLVLSYATNALCDDDRPGSGYPDTQTLLGRALILPLAEWPLLPVDLERIQRDVLAQSSEARKRAKKRKTTGKRKRFRPPPLIEISDEDESIARSIAAGIAAGKRSKLDVRVAALQGSRAARLALPESRGLDRWDPFRQFVALNYQGPIEVGDGFDEDDMDQVEDRLDLELPLVLWEFHRLVGRRLERCSILPLRELRLEQDRLFVTRDPDGWVRLADVESDDPQVWRETEAGDEELIADSLAQYLFRLLARETVAATSVYGAPLGRIREGLVPGELEMPEELE